MKVLFVYPILDSPPGINHGLAAMSGVLRDRGHSTRLVQITEALPPVPDAAAVISTVREWGADLVGLSVLTQQYGWALDFARALKAARPDLPVVIGGVHCTMVPEQVEADALAAPCWDYICVGEGELALAELCRRLEAGEPTGEIRGLRVVEGDRIRRNPVGPFPDLESLPPKHYDLFDMPRITAAKGGWLSILTSRGCPYQCTYCFNREIVDLYRREGGIKSAKEYLRRYPVGRIIDEIRTLRDRLPDLKTVILDDDLFTLHKGYVIDFCDAYAAAGIDLPFVVNAHPQSFDGEMAAALARVGCSIVKFGLESGSPRVRSEILHRYMSNERIGKSLAAAHAEGLHTSTFIMVGLPTETREEILETLRLCADTQVGRFRWAIFYPFPGTRAHTISEEKGLIDREKMAAMGNYFDASCLRFGPGHDLFIEKLAVLCHWYVNALGTWECADLYRGLVEEVEAMDGPAFRAAKERLVSRDRELSEDLIRQGLPHYSLRYSKVMGVHSDYVIRERRAEQASRGGAEYTME